MSADSFNEVFALTHEEILHYEVARAWWPQYVSWPWARRLASGYFAWKANRIVARFERTQAMFERVEEARQP